MPSMKVLASLLLALILSLPASVVAQAETLVIGGTGSALGTMQILGEAFAKKFPDIRIKVHIPSLGSSGGIRALHAKALDIAVSARPLKDKERAGGVTETPYGTTAVVFVTHEETPVENITTADLVAIYGGRQTRWPDNNTIRIILRPEVETDTKLLRKHIPGMAAAIDAARNRPVVPTAYTDQETADAIERIPGALSTAALSLVLSEQRPFRILSLDGIAATPETIANGRYPMIKTFYLVTQPGGSEAKQKFIAFVRSADGARILKRLGHAVPSTGGQ